MCDQFNLQRFLDAQKNVIDAALSELADGRKRTHWMWFIFPQISGLGHSHTACKYAITSRAEASVYAAHEVLGLRLKQCTQLVVQAVAAGGSVDEIFGFPDNLKFRSSMTLFAQCTVDDTVFRQAIETCCAGRADDKTLKILDDTE